jgi:Family of unknown function (DUF5996)
MTQRSFPEMTSGDVTETRDAVHAYSQVLGDWRASCLPRRKHWWHISVFPSARGLTTGLVQANIDFELELDMNADCLRARVADGPSMSEPLGGRPACELANAVTGFLTDHGIDRKLVPVDKQRKSHNVVASGYSSEVAANLAAVLRAISAAMMDLRARVAGETSPIQLWPHHFDLAMLYLTGEKIPGQDPADEELSDKQINFGFAFGDAYVPEPYFYITAYPFPDGLTDLQLPDGAVWQSEGFTGVVLRYRRLLEEQNPREYLVGLWRDVLSAGKQLMLDDC